MPHLGVRRQHVEAKHAQDCKSHEYHEYLQKAPHARSHSFARQLWLDEKPRRIFNGGKVKRRLAPPAAPPSAAFKYAVTGAPLLSVGGTVCRRALAIEDSRTSPFYERSKARAGVCSLIYETQSQAVRFASVYHNEWLWNGVGRRTRP